MRVAVVGAGVAGLASAVALARFTDVETVVYEQHRDVGPGVGLAVNLAPNGMRALGRLGLADRVIEQGCVLRIWEVRQTDGQVITRFPLQFERDYGYPMVAIRRELLMGILHGAAAGAGVCLRFGSRVTGVEQHAAGVRIQFIDRSTAEADVVAACDGAHSRIKAQVLGEPSAILTGQGQSFGISRPGDQHDLIKDTFTTVLGAGKYFGGYDIGHGEMLWYVGYNIASGRTWGAPGDLTADYALPAIRRLISGWDPPVPRVIDGTIRFGVQAVEHRPAPRTLRTGRVVLVGDAAHPVQLFFGQGASLALEDATTLALLMGDGPTAAGRAAVIDRALDEYSGIRLPRRVAVADYSREIGRRFHWTNPLKRQIRAVVLRRMGARTMDSAAWIYGHDHSTALPEHPS
jgi:2-polyprenyl-6-methoxyphenol hydroxylase-like FAD-dependent oxidoreductase